MIDLCIGLGIVALLSAALFIVALRTGGRLGRRNSLLLILGAVGLLVLHATVLLDSLHMAHLLPLSNLIVVGNLSVPVTAVLAGLAWAQVPSPSARRLLVVAPLLGICLWRAYAPLLADPPDWLGDHWQQEVCLQSSSASCSPAAAATLLRAHGIRTSEQEMAELCLTTDRGTSMHGLYRGLKLKTSGTAWDVQVVHGTLDDLQQLEGPVMISVGLRTTEGVDPRYHQRWGWTPGVKHTVVLFGFRSDGLIDIGDSDVGRETWDLPALRTLWLAEGLRLVPRAR